jgi:hypothetical protein
VTTTALELPVPLTQGVVALGPTGRASAVNGGPAEAWCSTLVDCCVCGETHAPGTESDPGCLATRHANEA